MSFTAYVAASPAVSPSARTTRSMSAKELGFEAPDPSPVDKKAESIVGHLGAKPNDPESRTRDNDVSRGIALVLDSLTMAIVGFIATIITLFAFDFTVAFLTPSVDLSTSVITLLCFSFFGLEIILQAIAREGYLFSFFFWMDLVGTISLIFDMSILTDWFFTSFYKISTNQAGVDYVSKTTSTLKVARLSRVVRIIRIVRIVRLLKIIFSRNKDNDTKKPSKFGNQLNLIIIQRLIMCVFLLVIIAPLLDNTGSELGLAKSEGLHNMETAWKTFEAANATNIAYLIATNSSYTPPLNYSVSAFFLRELQTSYLIFNPTLLQLNMLGYHVVYNDISTYRNAELGIWLTPNSASFATFSLRGDTSTTSAFDMVMTLCVIIIVLVSTTVIRSDIYAFVTLPIEKMTDLIKKLASTVCYLSENDENRPNDEDYETDIIENLLANLAGVFNVGVENKMEDLKILNVAKKGSSSPKKPDMKKERSISTLDDDTHLGFPELSSLETILNNNDVIPHFRNYMNSALSVESFLFWQEVKRYETLVDSACRRLFHSFVENNASQQVNISRYTVKNIESKLDNPSKGIFEEAKNEVFNLLRSNNFYPFLESKYCQAYIDERKRKRSRANSVDYTEAENLPNSVS